MTAHDLEPEGSVIVVEDAHLGVITEVLDQAEFADGAFQRVGLRFRVAYSLCVLAREVVEATIVAFVEFNLRSGEGFGDGPVVPLLQEQVDGELSLADAVRQSVERNMAVAESGVDGLAALRRAEVVQGFESQEQFVFECISLKSVEQIVMRESRSALRGQGTGLSNGVEQFVPERDRHLLQNG